jgi:tight adherence protein C
MTLILIIGLTLLAVSAGLAVRAAVLPRVRVLARVEAVAAYGGAQAMPVSPTPENEREPAVARLAARLGSVVANRAGDRVDTEQLRKLLLTAGFYRTQPETFLGYQVIAAVACGAYPILAGGLSVMNILMMALLAACGWIIPRFFVQRKGKFRAERIEDDLPDLIDLLVVTVEAGLSLSSSLATASRRIDGPLGDELRLAMQEQRMGLPVSDVLHNMLRRADNPSMRSFVRSLVQGETLGVSIGTILRNLADEMRERRRSRAEERANKAPVKMLFPLIFLIFPSLFIVLLGPAMIEIFRMMGSL